MKYQFWGENYEPTLKCDWVHYPVAIDEASNIFKKYH